MKEGWPTHSTTSTQAIDSSTIDVDATTVTTTTFDPNNVDLDTFDPESWEEYDSRFPRSILLFNGGVNASPELFADLRLMTTISSSPSSSPSLGPSPSHRPGIVSTIDTSALRQGFPIHDGDTLHYLLILTLINADPNISSNTLLINTNPQQTLQYTFKVPDKRL